MSTAPFHPSAATATRSLPGVWLDPRHGRIELSGRLPEVEWCWYDRSGTAVGRGGGVLTGNRLVLTGADADGASTEWHLVWYAGTLTGFVATPKGERPVKLWPVPSEGRDAD